MGFVLKNGQRREWENLTNADVIIKLHKVKLSNLSHKLANTLSKPMKLHHKKKKGRKLCTSYERMKPTWNDNKCPKLSIIGLLIYDRL